MADLVEVEIETLSGARYVMPDMPRSILAGAISSAGMEVVSRSGLFVLVNVSNASLTMPMRIVKTITWEGEVKWQRANPR